ncbi:glycosyltransferase family 39 protein [bacterium]|nr:MAG: glycosyltransferase family 39 protein [bacterium]
MKIIDSPRQTDSDAAIDPSWNTPRALWLSLGALFLLAIPLFFFRLGGWAFFDPDEGRYGEIPRAMLERGDFITPILNGVGFFDKPPLLYWGIALFYRVLGVSEGAARLVPALAALAAVFGAWALGRRMFGPRAGLLSGAILSTCIVWPAMARVVMTDMLVSSQVFLAMAFWWLSRTEKVEWTRTLHNFAFWTSLALGVLAKGPVAVVLTMGTIVLYALLSGDRSGIRTLGWKTGPLWLLLLAAPWFVLVQRDNPEFNHAFWIEQHFGRFLGRLVEQDHNYGAWYFFVVIPAIFFPWVFFAPAALATGWRKIWPGRGQVRSEKGRAALYLCCGVAFVTLFFTGSSSKLVTYILPVLPLMAVALGGYFETILRRGTFSWNRALAISAYALAFIVVILGIATWTAGGRALLKQNAAPTSAHLLSIALILWGVSIALGSWQRKLRGTVATVAVGFACIFAVSTELIRTIAEQTTTKSLIAYIQPGLRPDTFIISQTFTQSLTFYAHRRIAMLGEPDELRASLPHIPPDERKRWFIKDKDKADLKRLAKAKTPVYFISRHSYGRAAAFEDMFDGLGGDVEPIVANARFMLMGNAAARQLTPPQPGVEKFEQ